MIYWICVLSTCVAALVMAMALELSFNDRGYFKAIKSRLYWIIGISLSIAVYTSTRL